MTAADTSSIACCGCLQDGAQDALSVVLSKLRHLDLSTRVLDKEPAKEAHGGCCDVFIGCLAAESLLDRRVNRTEKGKVKAAIKHIRVRLDKDVQLAKTLARELAVWSKLDHQNILPLLGYAMEKTYPSLISEWMENGTVREFLSSHPDFDIMPLALGVAEGLRYIHDLNVIHSDIKSDNILIGDNFQPLICDFGISRMLDASQSIFVSTTHDGQTKGSTRWMATELHTGMGEIEPKHTKETDVWAFGMTLYEMITKELPYAHLKQDIHVLLAVMNGETPMLPPLQDSGSRLSPSSYDAICRICRDCWSGRPRERLTMTQITLALSSHRKSELQANSMSEILSVEDVLGGRFGRPQVLPHPIPKNKLLQVDPASDIVRADDVLESFLEEPLPAVLQDQVVSRHGRQIDRSHPHYSPYYSAHRREVLGERGNSSEEQCTKAQCCAEPGQAMNGSFWFRQGEHRVRDEATGAIGDSAEHGESLERFNQLDILHESNVSPRTESSTQDHKAQRLEISLNRLHSELDALKEEVKTLRAELDAKNADIRQIRDENRRWQEWNARLTLASRLSRPRIAKDPTGGKDQTVLASLSNSSVDVGSLGRHLVAAFQEEETSAKSLADEMRRVARIAAYHGLIWYIYKQSIS